MMACPECGVPYPEDFRFCPADQTVLVSLRPMAEARASRPVAPEADSVGAGASDLPGGRSWTARAALASGEITPDAVRAAEERAAAARAASRSRPGAVRPALLAAVLGVIIVVGAALWWLRHEAAPAPAWPRAASPTVAGGGIAGGGLADDERHALPPTQPLPPPPLWDEADLDLDGRSAAPRRAVPNTESKRDEPVARPAAPVRVPAVPTPAAPTPPPPPAPDESRTARSAVGRGGVVATVTREAEEQTLAVRSVDGRVWRLAKTFIPSTTFGTFGFQQVDGRPVVAFSAADPRWTTHYVWDYTAGVLYWRAYDGRSGAVTASPNVRPGSAIDEALRLPD